MGRPVVFLSFSHGISTLFQRVLVCLKGFKKESSGEWACLLCQRGLGKGREARDLLNIIS